MAEDQLENADFTCTGTLLSLSAPPFSPLITPFLDLGDEGMNIISDILLNNKKLKSLKLVRNKITDIMCFQILDSLDYNQSLISLNLASNRITAKVFDKLNDFT